MASLLERMDIVPTGRGGGPVRNRGGRAGAATPYTRARGGHSKADADAMWQHDMYNGPGKSLSSRLTDPSSSATGASRKVNASGADLALRKALGLSEGGVGGNLSIKGASLAANVVDVAGLVSGTTAADVEAIFKRCGPIVKSTVHYAGNDGVVVRLTFKTTADAQGAVNKFHGLPADGRKLKVTIIGSANATLSGRLGGVSNGTVDDLMDEDPDAGSSKMRSDDVLRVDPRAQVLTVPPGANPSDYQRQQSGRGKGRRGRGRRGGAAARMDLD